MVPMRVWCSGLGGSGDDGVGLWTPNQLLVQVRRRRRVRCSGGETQRPDGARGDTGRGRRSGSAGTPDEFDELVFKVATDGDDMIKIVRPDYEDSLVALRTKYISQD